MIQCASCQHQDYEGALFCSNCGAPLSFKAKTPTVTDHFGIPEAHPEPQPFTEGDDYYDTASARVCLKVVDGGQLIPLEGVHEFTLGRVSGSQPILPDIDLTPFKAYEGGVSRLHATIRIDQDAIHITDLGSANGTRINGKKMPAHSSQELRDGDFISLGKFRLQILDRKSNE